MLFKLLSVVLTLSFVVASRDVEEYLGRISENYEKAQVLRVSRILFPFLYLNYTDVSYKQPQLQPPVRESNYDFVVIGSGSSGSALANRLSEIPNWNVLLLEVGQEPHPITDIPIAAPAFQFTNYTWGYLAERQENVGLGLVDQRIALPRGRALGGSSVVDYMIQSRGNRLDYDQWGKRSTGWAYEEVLPFFKKLEDSHLSAETVKYHGKGGPLTTENVPHITESAHTFVRAGQQFGLKYRCVFQTADYNGKSQIGLSYVQATLRNGRRCSAEKAYLRPIRARTNLKVLTKARASKILVDPVTKTALGVEYLRGGNTYTVKVSKEVILSAGTFESPKLLLLSGIGPKLHIQELGIPQIHDLPVGESLYDHVLFPGLVFTVNDSSIVNNGRATENLQSYLEFIEQGRGPLTTTNLIEALAYPSDVEKGSPDVELVFMGGGLHTDRGAVLRKGMRISDRVYDAVFRPVEDKGAFMIVPKLLRPKSVGYLRLKSPNVFKWPKLYANYLTQNSDVRILIGGIRDAQKLVQTPAFKKYNATQVATRIPGCEQPPYDSDAYWECAIRHLAVSGHNQVGTCKMGDDGVVDARLRVHGVKNLRVVDESVIPTPLTGYGSVPAAMIGEKAAEIVKRDFRVGAGENSVAM